MNDREPTRSGQACIKGNGHISKIDLDDVLYGFALVGKGYYFNLDNDVTWEISFSVQRPAGNKNEIEVQLIKRSNGYGEVFLDWKEDTGEPYKERTCYNYPLDNDELWTFVTWKTRVDGNNPDWKLATPDHVELIGADQKKGVVKYKTDEHAIITITISR